MTKVEKIFSENDKFQYIETIRRNREKRNKSGEFFIEGVRPINQALAYHWPITTFIYASDKPLSGWATSILKKSAAQKHIELPYSLLQKLSQKEETSELLALVQIPKDDLSRIPLSPDLLVIVFDRPASPGNLGTIMRSGDALGAQGLILTGHAVDLYDPEVISASTGSFFALPTVRLPSHKELLPWIKKIKAELPRLQVVGTDETGSELINNHDFTAPTILLVGNETWGLSEAYKELANSMVNIPMHGSASSLNVANATSIVLYEIGRQRKQK